MPIPAKIREPETVVLVPPETVAIPRSRSARELLVAVIDSMFPAFDENEIDPFSASIDADASTPASVNDWLIRSSRPCTVVTAGSTTSFVSSLVSPGVPLSSVSRISPRPMLTATPPTVIWKSVAGSPFGPVALDRYDTPFPSLSAFSDTAPVNSYTRRPVTPSASAATSSPSDSITSAFPALVTVVAPSITNEPSRTRAVTSSPLLLIASSTSPTVPARLRSTSAIVEPSLIRIVPRTTPSPSFSAFSDKSRSTRPSADSNVNDEAPTADVSVS